MAEGDPKCPKCRGVSRWTYEEDDGYELAIPCVCIQRDKLRRYINNHDIWRSRLVKSGLLTDDRDATTENLFIAGTWDMMCQHLHWVLAFKFFGSPSFTFRLTDDNQLLRIWLGEYAYRNRPQASREDKTVWNGLDDFLEDPSLVVIKLGAVRRNKAAGDVLEVALRTRARASKPTWIVEDTKVYDSEHPSYSHSAYNYIQERFTKEDIGGDVEAARAKQLDLDRLVEEFGTTMDKDEKGIGRNLSVPGEYEPEDTREYNSGGDEDDFGLPSGGNKSRKRGKW